MEVRKVFAKLKLVQNEELNNFNSETDEFLENLEREQAIVNPTPNNPPWNSWIAIGMWIVSVMLIAFLPVLFFFPYAVNQNIDLSDSQALTDFLRNSPTAIILNLIAVFPAHIFTLVLAWFVVTGNKRYSFRQTLGWSNNNFRWFYYIIIIVGFFVIASVDSYFLPEQENDLLRILRSSYTATLIVAFLATFTAPMVEEVVYRGILYSAFQRRIGVTGAVGIVTMLFAGVHFLQYWGSPGTILLICLLSLILTLVRVKSDNLLPCIILHTIFNGLQSLVLVLEPYLPKTPPETQEVLPFIIRLLT